MDLPATLSGKIVLALYAAPLLIAAGYDLWTFRIPNAVTGAMLVAFPLAALITAVPVEWLAHLGAGALVFAGGTALFALNLFGGGDVKLAAVAALWLGWDNLLAFLLLIGAFGGLLALAVILMRSPVMQPVFVSLNLRAKILDAKAGIPYGIAITIAGLWLTGKLPLLG